MVIDVTFFEKIFLVPTRLDDGEINTTIAMKSGRESIVDLRSATQCIKLKKLIAVTLLEAARKFREYHSTTCGKYVKPIAEHGITQEDFEQVVCHPGSKGFSRSSGLPAGGDTAMAVKSWQSLRNWTK